MHRANPEILPKNTPFHPVQDNVDPHLGLKLYKNDEVFSVDIDDTRYMWNILVFKSGACIPGIGYKDAGIYLAPVFDLQDEASLGKHFEGYLLSVPFPFWNLLDIYNLDLHFTSLHFNPFVELDNKEADNLCLLMSLIGSALTEGENPYSNMELMYLCRAFLVMINKCYLGPQDDSHEARTTKNRHVNRFLDLVEKNCLKEKKLEYYAKQLGITTKYLSTTVSKNTGKTASKWISDSVIEKANKMLCSTASQINEIAKKLGFDNASDFCRYYRACMGATPMQYRKESKDDTAPSG